MADRVNEPETQPDIEHLDPEAVEISDRREFLRSLGKWSTAAIAAIVLTESSQSNSGNNKIEPPASSIGDGGWKDQGGGGWLNSRGGGGGWVNRRGW